jgi:pyruvate dehydrogenase (quinone)
MSEQSVSDLIVDRLESWGVRRIFGYSGDGINAFMGALRRAKDRIEFVQARHEENAAFMAVGHAKYSGEVGVVTSTQGPGAVHLLNGLYDAKLDGVPVVAIIGQQTTSVLGSAYMQEIDLPALVKDVAGFAQQVSTPEQLPMVLDRAFRSALTERSPAVVILPHDVQKEPAPQLDQEHGIVVTAPAWSQPTVLPGDDDLDAAAAVLNAGSRVALLVGQGARHAREAVVDVAERLGAGVATSLLGKPYVDESRPDVVGTIGHLGTTASAFLMAECDTLLIVGSNDPWTEFYPPPGKARAVQIDIDGRVVGNRYPIEVSLVGDASASLSALLPRLQPAGGAAPWRGEVERAVREWRALAEERAHTPADPVNPERVVWELNSRLPADAQLAIDVGSCVYWYARQLRVPPGVPAHLSGTLASMGCSIPYGIAAKLLHPDRPLLALTGDGAMQMTGLAELVTVSRLWTQWSDPRFVVCVLHNGDLAEVSWEQREMEGEPLFPDSQDLPAFPYAGYAELIGLRGIRVDDPDRLGSAWEAALTADRPTVLEVLTDRAVPLLAPFPAGAEKLESMRKGLAAEGESGRHARELLDVYAAQEGGSSR